MARKRGMHSKIALDNRQGTRQSEILHSESLADGGSAIVRRCLISPSRRRCWSCTAIHCVHFIRQLYAADLFQNKGTTYLRYAITSPYVFEMPLPAGRSVGQTGSIRVLFSPLFLFNQYQKYQKT